MSNDPTADPAGQEPLPVCDRCGPTRGMVMRTPNESLCLTCLFPDAVCNRCAGSASLWESEGRYYCEHCYQVAVFRMIGRLEVFAFLGKKPEREALGMIMDSMTALPTHQAKPGGRPPKVTPTTAPDYAKVLRQTVRAWRSLNERRIPTKRDLFLLVGPTFGYRTYRGFQGFTAKLEEVGYPWPDAYL